MKYLLITVLCVSVLLLCACFPLIYYIAGDKVHYTECYVEDSETNRLKVMQVVRLIADRYGLQDLSGMKDARVGRVDYSTGYTIVAYYYAAAAGSEKPWSDIRFKIYAFQGKLKASLYQQRGGRPSKKYNEIQDRLVSEFKERFGAEVDIDTWHRML